MRDLSIRIRTGILLIMMICTSIHFSFSFAEESKDNLIQNGGFEETDSDGMPEGWMFDAWDSTVGYSRHRLTEDPDQLHGQVIEIRNSSYNDARFFQTVDVEPETVYRLSGYILASNIRDEESGENINGHGANLSIEGVYVFSEAVYDTNGDWEYVECYGQTGPDQYQVTVYARVGGYGRLSCGTAQFDQIELIPVENVPDIVVDLWFTPDSAEPDDDYADSDTAEEEAGSRDARTFLLISGFGWMAALLLVIWVFQIRKSDTLLHHENNNAPSAIVFFVALILGLLLRLILSYFVEGYSVDVNCFTSWGATMAQYGPVRFYEKTGFCDYPPAYTYILGLNSWAADATHASVEWTRVIFRLVPSLCDMIYCIILFVYARKKDPERLILHTAVLSLIVLNPAMITNSACWGQMDSVLCLALVMVALCAAEGKWQCALPVYTLSVLIKPQALMLGFLGLAYMIMTVIRRKESRKPMLIGAILSAVVLFAGILPFGIQQHFGWLIEQYKSTLESYPYATVNTANIYYLLGGNWNGINMPAHILAPIAFAVAAVVYTAIWTMRSGKYRYYWIESILGSCFIVWFLICIFSGLGWNYSGSGAMAFAFLITISLAVRKTDIRFLPYLGALLFILLYTFGVKMHERYLFPALFLLGFAWILQKDRRILYLLGVFTVTLYLNEGIILDNSIRLPGNTGHLLSDTVILADLISIVNIISAVIAVIIGYRMLEGEDTDWQNAKPYVFAAPQMPRKRNPLDFHPDRRLHWRLKDTLILTGITLAYSAVSLLTLGSTKAPQTFWKSSSMDEEIVFDLGQSYDDIRILYFGQVSYYDFWWSESKDGVEWSEAVPAQMDQGQCWKWKYVTRSWEGTDGKRTYYNSEDYVVHFSGRYLKLLPEQVGLTLNEIIFRDRDGNAIPVAAISRSGEDPESVLYSDPRLLSDEPDTIEEIPSVFATVEESSAAQPSWWNSTYFDEIYHARTGYEFTQGTVPYETTHPPLGKILISWCISIFGMTPFGWRFAGAMAGILMLPGIYLLAKQLTKKTFPAAVACLLMALDCMHLTQTQIATIDSYPVLFIIFAYFFMLRYMQTDVIRQPLRRSIVPLCLSGLFMGFSIASKWIGIYAGAGLAILYFWHGIRQIRMDRMSEKMLQSSALTPNERDRLAIYTQCKPGMTKRLIILSVSCVVFFILIPLGIYLISYIPYMAYNTSIHSFGDYLNAVWKAQEGMLKYHSTPGLGMDHPFYSPWYEWPFILKPMYYANEQYVSRNGAMHYSIFCFGNPVVWWTGIIAFIGCVISWLCQKHYTWADDTKRALSGYRSSLSWHFSGRSYDIRYAFVLIALMAQYFPWVPVPRGTYIYHYFASVPFLILTICLMLSRDTEHGKTARYLIGAAICLLALIAFMIFFPYATGFPASSEWLNIGKKILLIYY